MKSKEFNPYSVVIEITSTENFYMAHSSNGYDVYGLLMTGDGSAICGCPAGNAGVNCRHRKALLARFVYTTPLDEILDEVTWQRIKNNMDREAELDEVRNLFSDGPEAA